MRVAQARRRLDRPDVENTRMRRAFGIRLLQRQNVHGFRQHVPDQNPRDALRIDAAVAPAPAMHVPRHAGEISRI